MATNWFCGHCSFGPMMIETTEFCVMCHRQRDSYATYENLRPPFTISLNQPEPGFGGAHCGNPGLIAYQQPKPEKGARGQAVQERALTPTRWYCCQGGDGPGYLNAKMRCLNYDLENCRDYSKAP